MALDAGKFFGNLRGAGATAVHLDERKDLVGQSRVAVGLQESGLRQGATL